MTSGGREGNGDHAVVPVPGVARHGRTIRKWRDVFLAHGTTDRSDNAGTGAIDGLVVLHRQAGPAATSGRGSCLRLLLVAGGLQAYPLALAPESRRVGATPLVDTAPWE